MIKSTGLSSKRDQIRALRREFSKRSDKGGSLEEVLSILRLAEEIIAAQQEIIDRYTTGIKRV